jgi:hypothetical protein
MVQNLPFFARKIPNKIEICGELNKEELSLMKLFKIQDRI